MEPYYPPAAFHFRVRFELTGETDLDTRFQEVSGLDRELEVVNLDEGGENRFSYRLPGRAKYTNLVLKRGMVTNSELVRWFKAAVDNLEIKPVGVTISLLDRDHQPVRSWKLVGAWPVKWSVSSLDAQKNGIVVDTIELAYRYYTQE